MGGHNAGSWCADPCSLCERPSHCVLRAVGGACWAPERNKGDARSQPSRSWRVLRASVRSTLPPRTAPAAAAGEDASGPQLRACPCQPRPGLCLSCQSLCSWPSEAASGAGAGEGAILARPPRGSVTPCPQCGLCSPGSSHGGQLFKGGWRWGWSQPRRRVRGGGSTERSAPIVQGGLRMGPSVPCNWGYGPHTEWTAEAGWVGGCPALGRWLSPTRTWGAGGCGAGCPRRELCN